MPEIDYLPLTALGNADTFAQDWQSRYLPLWQSMRSGVLVTADSVQLQYYAYRTAGASQAFVISPGRMELAIKYAELAFELVQAGYSVYILDHRGQGLSQRELANPHKGYINDFSQYQQDLAYFVEQIVLPDQHSRHIALGHSMGCAILAGYLQNYPHPFSASVLASPMFGIYTGLVPYRLAQSLALAFGQVNRLLSKDIWYFPGQGDYHEKPFSHNPLSHCQNRYQWLMQLYQQYPKAQLGGVTTRWISAAISAMHQIQQKASQWSLPVLLLQAGADKVVSNHAQNLWFQQLDASLLHSRVYIAQAKHEIFMETDSVRQQAISAIDQFLRQLPSRA